MPHQIKIILQIYLVNFQYSVKITLLVSGHARMVCPSQQHMGRFVLNYGLDFSIANIICN